MDKIFTDNVLMEPLMKFVTKIAGFLPSLFIAAILIIVGFFLATILRAVVSRLSRLLKMDRLSEKVGLTQILQKSGIKEPVSWLVGNVIYWIVLISFVIMGLDALKIPAVENLLQEFWFYVPNVIAAAVILVAGYLLGNFLGRAALIAAVNAGIAISGLIGKFVKFTVFIMATTMALELLGIGEATVLIAFAVVFGGVVLALAIAFGLGGRDAAKDYIDKMLTEKKEEDDIHHI
jgi:small-conductance mechanosensitive channel